MNTIKKILVPVDFSAASRHGLHYAMQFASMIEASIVLYHSFVPFESGFYPLQKQIDENDALLKALRTRLDKLKDNELKHGRKITISTCVDMGAEGRQIPKYCREKNIDLIVMGTTGAGGAKKFLTGSFASQVMRRAPCPVLAIPPGAVFKIPKKITYASDYHETDIGCLDYLLSLNEPFKAKINIVHVVDDQHSAPIEDESLELHQEKIIHALGGVSFAIDIVQGEEISRALLKYTIDTHSDILAIAHTAQGSLWNRLFHKSVTKASMHHSPVPVLAFPAPDLNRITSDAGRDGLNRNKEKNLFDLKDRFKRRQLSVGPLTGNKV